MCWIAICNNLMLPSRSLFHACELLRLLGCCLFCLVKLFCACCLLLLLSFVLRNCFVLVAVVKFCFAQLFCACCLLLLLSFVLFCFAWLLLVLFVKLFLPVAVLNCLYCWVDAGFVL